jgi:ABC-type uncharacterized transport system permease subunit
LAELLVLPALLAYGEAAVAYGADVRRPGRPGRLATWGVRIGWLAQTALLAAQAVQAEGFPWTSWAGALNLFVWLVIGVYLVWGCRARYRLLGLAVMPFAFALLALAWVGGGTTADGDSRFSDAFLVLHVGLLLAAFAGFALAAALSGLYLFQERRLRRREASILRVPAPSLAALDRFAARTIALALPVLTFGIGVGLVRLAAEGGAADAAVVVTLVTWGAYLGSLGARVGLGWRGRRAAYLALACFALVVLTLPIAHFS